MSGTKGHFELESGAGNGGHVPVLVGEVLEVLAPRPGQTYVDLTAGLGGHAEVIGRALAPGGRLILLDLDRANLDRAVARLAGVEGVSVEAVHGSFDEAPARLAAMGLRADLVLGDLGFSSNQMDDPSRGFSFLAEGPLDMRLDPSAILTAGQIVNRSSMIELAEIFGRYGEEPLAKKIAREIAEFRERRPIETTAQLVEIVRHAYGARTRSSRKHPATKVFMALRIAVNDELGRLERFWTQLGGHDVLAAQARVAFITFHSLEDRIVKHAMADLVKAGRAQRLTRKPITADEDERTSNVRSRSAKLRAIAMTGPVLSS